MARNAVIVAATVAVAEALTQAIKFTAERQRPYVYYQHVNPASGVGKSDFPSRSSDANLSFPSGHTSLAAAVGTSATMFARWRSLRRRRGCGELPASRPWPPERSAWSLSRVISPTSSERLGAGCAVLFPLQHRRGSALGTVMPSFAATQRGAAFSLGGAF